MKQVEKEMVKELFDARRSVEERYKGKVIGKIISLEKEGPQTHIVFETREGHRLYFKGNDNDGISIGRFLLFVGKKSIVVEPDQEVTLKYRDPSMSKKALKNFVYKKDGLKPLFEITEVIK